MRSIITIAFALLSFNLCFRAQRISNTLNITIINSTCTESCEGRPGINLFLKICHSVTDTDIRMCNTLGYECLFESPVTSSRITMTAVAGVNHLYEWVDKIADRRNFVIGISNDNKYDSADRYSYSCETKRDTSDNRLVIHTEKYDQPYSFDISIEAVCSNNCLRLDCDCSTTTKHTETTYSQSTAVLTDHSNTSSTAVVKTTPPPLSASSSLSSTDRSSNITSGATTSFNSTYSVVPPAITTVKQKTTTHNEEGNKNSKSTEAYVVAVAVCVPLLIIAIVTFSVVYYVKSYRKKKMSKIDIDSRDLLHKKDKEPDQLPSDSNSTNSSKSYTNAFTTEAAITQNFETACNINENKTETNVKSKDVQNEVISDVVDQIKFEGREETTETGSLKTNAFDGHNYSTSESSNLSAPLSNKSALTENKRHDRKISSPGQKDTVLQDEVILDNNSFESCESTSQSKDFSSSVQVTDQIKHEQIGLYNDAIHVKNDKTNKCDNLANEYENQRLSEKVITTDNRENTESNTTAIHSFPTLPASAWTMETEILNLKQQFTEAEQRATNLHNDLEKVTTKWTQDLNKLKDKLESIEHKILGDESKRAAETAGIRDRLQQETKMLNENVAENSKAISELKSKLTASVENTDNNVSSLQENILQLRTSAFEDSSNLGNGISSLVQNLSAKIDHLERMIEQQMLAKVQEEENKKKKRRKRKKRTGHLTLTEHGDVAYKLGNLEMKIESPGKSNKDYDPV